MVHFAASWLLLGLLFLYDTRLRNLDQILLIVAAVSELIEPKGRCASVLESNLLGIVISN